MNIRNIYKQSHHLLSKIILCALLGIGTAGSLMACSNTTTHKNRSSKPTLNKTFVHSSKYRQQEIINHEELAHLQNTGNLKAIQADKKIQHINATQHQRFQIPYTRSADGNYWSYFTDHYVPRKTIYQVLLANRSSVSDSSMSGSIDEENDTLSDSKKFDNEIQKNLMKHNVNYGINFTILGNSASNALDCWNSSASDSDMPVKYYSMNSQYQKWANKRELNYLKDTGNTKAKKADNKIKKLDKKHHQKYPIPYTKSSDGNYWSWYQKHSIPKIIIKRYYNMEKKHDSDYDLSGDSGYITHRLDNDIQFNLMKHGVNYGVNYNSLSSKLSNKIDNWEND